MAQSDAKIKYLEQELDEQEKMITMMENPVTAAATEDRLVALEKKVRDMEALMKGLTQELLDLKSVAMKMSKQTEERSRQELKRDPDRPGIHSRRPQQADRFDPGRARSSCRKGARQAEPGSTSGTGNGHDHAVRRHHEARTPSRRQGLYRRISGIRAQQERDLCQGKTERPHLRC